MIAVTVFLTVTFAMLAYTFFWAVSAHRPVRARPHRTGRSAVPYWHTTSGMQDERGIVARPTGRSVAQAPPQAATGSGADGAAVNTNLR